MALPQVPHQQAVRQHDEVHVPGLALAVTQLTVPHAQLLLAIPMKGLRACPPIPITPYNPADFPPNPVGHQDNAWRGVVAAVPQDNNPNTVLHVRDTQGTGEVPLRVLALPQRLAHAGFDLSRQRRRLEQLPLVRQLAIELERADVATRL